MLWTLLCGGCMAVMLVFAAGKTIVIADVERGEAVYQPSENAGDTGEKAAEPLSFRKNAAMVSRLSIPLESGIKADRVMVENRYMEKELWIYIKKGDRAFYREHVISGDIAVVQSGIHEVQGEDIVLKIQMDNVFEYRSTLEEGHLYVEYLPPGEVYDRIIVIDPGCGGDESGFTVDGYAEKELTLEIAGRLKKKLDKTDIKVYYTRVEDIGVTPEERAEIANLISADMFISIGAAGDVEAPEKYGISCLYNHLYFIPGLGNPELADLLERQVVTAVSGRAEGLVEAQDGSVLSLLKVPGVQLQAGYLTNPEEGYLLQQEEYLDRLTDGIAAAIEEAYLLLENK